MKAWAEKDPSAVVGVWRRGCIVETSPFNPTTGKPITAAGLARYEFVFSYSVDDEVFAFCDKHQTAFSGMPFRGQHSNRTRRNGARAAPLIRPGRRALKTLWLPLPSKLLNVPLSSSESTGSNRAEGTASRDDPDRGGAWGHQ